MSLSSLRTKNAAVNLSGRSAVVVGATSGIGKGIARRLAQANANVTVVGRDEARGAELVEQMKTLGSGSHSFVRCDAQLLSNVRTFVKDLATTHKSLDYLVLTQGIASTEGYSPTAEGIDKKMALHFYSRMAFIDGLLPLLKQSAEPKVLSVLSAGVHSPYLAFKDDPELKKNFTLKNAADAAGMYNDLMLDALSRENPEVAFVHAAPGFVNTSWGTELPFYWRALVRVVQPFAKSIDDCAEFMCAPLFDAAVKGGFHLLDQYAKPAKKMKPEVHSDDNVAWMRAHCAEVLGRAK